MSNVNKSLPRLLKKNRDELLKLLELRKEFSTVAGYKNNGQIQSCLDILAVKSWKIMEKYSLLTPCKNMKY